jgi:hypothetical protein
MTARSLRSRKAVKETKEANAINVESETSEMSGGEVSDLDLKSVNSGEEQEDLDKTQNC